MICVIGAVPKMFRLSTYREQPWPLTLMCDVVEKMMPKKSACAVFGPFYDPVSSQNLNS
jgi:hypothetical protein